MAKKEVKTTKPKVRKKKKKAPDTNPERPRGPKQKASKSRVAVAARRKKIIRELVAGKSNFEAGVAAGLSPKTAECQVSQILNIPKVREEFRKLLDKCVPDDALAAKYSDLMSAKKVISAMVIAPNGEGMKDANSMTKDFIEVEDCATQLRTADSVSKLKGYLSDKHEVDVNLPITVIINKFSDGNNTTK